ncbi:MAG: hypothetical protein ACI4UK_08250 [Floccifex sp.]
MITGITENGFKYEIDEGVKDDWEIIETLSEMAEIEITKNPMDSFRLTIKLALLVLGKKQYEDLKIFLKNKYGRIRITQMEEEIIYIFKNINELKN